MKQTLVVAVLFLFVLVLALWALGVFAPAPALPPEVPPEAPPSPPAQLPPRVSEPTTEPPPEIPEIAAPVRVLLLADATRPFLRWVCSVFDLAPKVAYQVWSAQPVPGTTANLHGGGLPALESAPKAADLGDVQILVVDDLDPAALPAEFWERVAERVKGGSLGLWISPGAVHGPALVEQASLKPLLPVSGFQSLKGTGPGGQGLPAGVFGAERPFATTAKTFQHPASRLSPYEKWSRRKWEAYTKGEKRWGTAFAYPVTEGKTGSADLLDVEGPGGETIPALVLSDPVVGRVLWTGFFDLGGEAYRDGQRSFGALQSLVLGWVLWLAPPGG